MKFNSIKGLDSDELRNIYMAILFKTCHSFEGAIFLLSNFEVKPLFRLTFSSTIRDIISDLVLADFLSFKESEENIDMKNLIDKIYADHIIFTDSKLKLNKALFGESKDYGKIEEEFKLKSEKYKDENGKLKKEYRKRSMVFDKIGYLNSRMNKQQKETLKDLYEWYSDLSKLSHFGSTTIKVIEKYLVTSPSDSLNTYYQMVVTIFNYSIGLLKRISNGQDINGQIAINFDQLIENNSA